MSLRTISKSVSIAVIAAIGMAAVMPASAADLGYGYGSTKDGPYDDPRYSDVYKHPAPPPRYAAPVPPAPVYPPQHYAPPPPAYYGPAPRFGHAPPDCLPRHLIRQKLEGRGWRDFHDVQVSGNVAHTRARRPHGGLFDLTVDRCTGEVLQAEAIQDRHAYAPPAYAPPVYAPPAYAPPPPADWRYNGGGYRY
jgi:hypothetical protein